MVGLFQKIKWWFFHRFHPKHRYNVVKTGLKPGYYDCDIQMFHACFSLLVGFVERECAHMEWVLSSMGWSKLPKPKSQEDRERYGLSYLDGMAKNHEEYKTLKDLYIWWKYVRPNREEPETYQNMESQEDEDTENLKKLVEIRGIMWT